MDNRPIGVFDSGVGGLTAVRTIQQAAPNESIVYFGDTARVPYGNRTKEDITALSLQDVRFLRAHKLKAILIACNTITANALDALCAENRDIPITGTVDSSVNAAIRATKNKRIGIIATQATVHSGIYEQEIKRRLSAVDVFSQSCPKFVPLIEGGHIAQGDLELEAAVMEYLAPIKAQNVDTVILGCTHYPLIRNVIQTYMGKKVSLVDSGGESAKALLNELSLAGSLAEEGKMGTSIYYCSARANEFERIAEVFLNCNICGKVVQTDISRF